MKSIRTPQGLLRALTTLGVILSCAAIAVVGLGASAATNKKAADAASAKEAVKDSTAGKVDKAAPVNNAADPVLMITGETDGYLKPCGCVSFQLGGLPRRVQHFQEATKGSSNVLTLSNGRLFEGPGHQNELEATVIAQCMEKIGYSVVNLTERELVYGAEYIANMFVPIAGVKFVSANYQPEELLQFGVLQPFVMEEMNVEGKTYRLGITGAFQNDLYSGVVPYEPQRDATEALTEVLGQMDAFDFRIVLFMGEYEAAKSLAKDLQAAGQTPDLIVSGWEQDAPETSLTMVGDTAITKTGQRGKHLVKLVLRDAAKGKPTLDYTKIEVTDTYGEDEQMAQLLKQHTQNVSDLKLLEENARTQASPDGDYVGTAVCGACHIQEYEIWKLTRHAEAFETLEEINHHRDPECIYCHVVGYPKKTGYVNLKETPNLVDVGCENCHGPGSEHIKAPGQKPYKNANEDKCVQCHKDDHDPHWDWKKWEKIKHGPQYNEEMLKKLRAELEKKADEKDEKSAY